MPVQRLSLFAPLPARHLETLIAAVQTLTTTEYLTQFKTITHIYKDESTAQGRRASDFLRLRQDASESDDVGTSKPVIEVIDAPEISKKPITSRIVHSVPCHAGDLTKLVLSMGYSPSYSFFEQGYALLIGSINLRVYRIFRATKKSNDVTTNTTATEEGLDNGESGGEYDGVGIGDGTTWIVHADIEVSTGSPDDLRRGQDELVRLKKELQGYVDLQPLIDELR